jgi:hypothetical protein
MRTSRLERFLGCRCSWISASQLPADWQ